MLNPFVRLVCPPFLFGPFAPGFHALDKSVLSTNGFIYHGLLNKNGGLESLGPDWQPGVAVDVRDVAQALVGALISPSNIGRKRVLISGEWFCFKDAAEWIAEARPELKDRLTVNADKFPPAGKTLIDNTRAKEILGIQRITPWRETVLAAVDDLLRVEKNWIQQGLTP